MFDSSTRSFFTIDNTRMPGNATSTTAVNQPDIGNRHVDCSHNRQNKLKEAFHNTTEVQSCVSNPNYV